MRHCLITKLFPKGLGGKEGEAPKPMERYMQEGGQKAPSKKPTFLEKKWAFVLTLSG
jgi:hypothetical protein